MQLIVGMAPTGNSMHASCGSFERARGGDESVAGPFRCCLEKTGRWGTGLAGQNEPASKGKSAMSRGLQAFSRLVSFWMRSASCLRAATIHTIR